METKSSIADEIQKLDELRSRGVITSDEFANRKSKLFSGPVEASKNDSRPGTILASGIIILSLAIGGLAGGSGEAILLSMLGLSLYLLPALIAYQRSHINRHAIFLVNLLLGWSIIGWVVALIWSATSAKAVA
jgi:hypothetical protein